MPFLRLLRAALPAASLLLAPVAGAGPVLPCPDGPDPLRFRPELRVPGPAVSALAAPCPGPEPSCPGAVAIDAAIDSVTGAEWVAVAWRSDSEELIVSVSADGGVGFSALPATVVSAGPVAGRPAVALRVDDGALRLGVAWSDAAAGELKVRLTDTLDGSFGGEAVLGAPPRDLAAALVVTPAPAAPLFAAAAHDAGSGQIVVATSGGVRDPASWSAAVPALGAANGRMALAADAAGAGGGAGFTLALVDDALATQVLRSDDAGASWSAPLALGDGSFGAWAPVLDSAPDSGAADAAWTLLALHARDAGGPMNEWLAADATRRAAGALDHDFDASAGPLPVSIDANLATGSLPAAAAGSSEIAWLAWEDRGELQFARRLLAANRPVLAGGCGGSRLTGLDPARTGGGAGEPAASSLGRDLVAAFVDDRSGSRELWIKRSDDDPPATPVLMPTASACGDIPSAALAWDPPAPDVVSQVLEVGTMPGGTDFTRDAGLGAALIVEGLQPATSYWFRLRVTDAAGHEVVSDEVTADTPACADALLVSSLQLVTDACAFGGAGGDGTLDPGETATLRFRVENQGTVAAPAVRLRVFSRTPELLVQTGNIDLGDLDVGASAEGDVAVQLSATLPCGALLEALVRMQIGDGTRWADLQDLTPPPGCTPCASAACSVTADASATAPQVICNGDAAVLDAGATTSVDCAGVLLHEWFEGGNLVGTNAMETVSPGGTTTYRLVTRCSTDLSCTAEATVEVVVNPLPNLGFTEDPPPPQCEGEPVTLTATTNDPGATFAWDTGEDTATIQVTASGVYRCTVTDTNGCVRSRSFRVDQGPAPLADAGPAPDSMRCAPVTIGTPGFPLLDYSWDPPDGLDDPTSAQPQASPATATTYTLTVTDPLSGCFATDQVMVDVQPPPELVTDLLVRKDPAGLETSWSSPSMRPVRLYGETEAALARSANGASGTASLLCEGTDTCVLAAPAGALVFLQAVSVCEDGLSEGPN